MKSILHWVDKYLTENPPKRPYSLNGGKSKGGSAIYSLDVYGTADTFLQKKDVSTIKTGPEALTKRSPEEIEKTLEYVRKDNARVPGNRHRPGSSMLPSSRPYQRGQRL